MRFQPLALLSLALPLAALGCVSTSGRAWLREPADAALGTDAEYADLAPPPAGATPEAVDGSIRDATEAPRPRLAHVISLGESENGSARATTPTSGVTSGPTVVVNVVNYGTIPYSGGYGYPLTYRTATTGAPLLHSAPSSGGTPAIGGDWRAAPSYGPSFPWRTGPAPAWERPR